MNRRKVAKLALFVDVKRPAAVEAAKTIAGIASQAGVVLQIQEAQRAALGFDGAVSITSFPRGADVLISLGGDGTLLQAAHLAAPLGIPIMGVDFGRMGFLTQANRWDYQTIVCEILRSGLQIESHIALEASLGGASRRYFAVNDIHIDRRHQGHIVGFGVEIEGEHVAQIPADGMIVSTPTGSTAYFLSAGGPILSPRLDAFGIAPICPHTLFSRPLVVSADQSIRITVSGDSSGAQLYADGRLEGELPPNSAVDIVKAAQTVDFVRLDNRFFFQVLERKLHWGTSIKRPAE